jgi:hypothetical protein
MNERRKALSLAAVLAATTLTGAAAVLGITRTAPPAPSLVQPAVVYTPPSVPQEEAD